MGGRFLMPALEWYFTRTDMQSPMPPLSTYSSRLFEKHP
jgi:hypothetical protein